MWVLTATVSGPQIQITFLAFQNVLVEQIKNLGLTIVQIPNDNLLKKLESKCPTQSR